MAKIEEIAAGLNTYLEKHPGELFVAATWSPKTPSIHFRMGFTPPYIGILYATRKSKSEEEGNKISLITPSYAELGNPNGPQNNSHTALPELRKGAVNLTELWFGIESSKFFPIDFANLGLYSNVTVNGIHRVVALGNDNVTHWFYNQARFGAVDRFTREKRLKEQQDEMAEDLKTAKFARQNPKFPPFHPKPIDEYFEDPFLVADFSNMKGALTGSYELPEGLQNVLEALRQRTVNALRERLELSEKANPNHRGRLEGAINPMLVQTRVLGLDRSADNYRLVFMGEEISVSEFIQMFSTPKPPAIVETHPRPRNYKLHLKRYRG